jgi:hypothetical protein
MNIRSVLRALAAAALLANASARAAPAGEPWKAYSMTAISITGDITFSPDRITFGNGKSLPLAAAGSVPGFKGDDGKQVNATLFRVTAPDDPVLLSGQRLCGGHGPQPVIFIVAWTRERRFSADPDLRTMAAFSGSARPTGAGGPGFCGTYNYQPRGTPISGQQVSGEGTHSGSRETALFDHPVTVQRVPAKTSADPVGEVRCTYYPDLMVKETGTDSPNPGNATIVPVSGASEHPACTHATTVRGAPLKTDGYYLIGKKGPYLVFAVADPSGAQNFKIIDAGTGQQIFADSRRSTGFRSAAVENGALHVRYTRAVNGPCSIVKEGSVCWAKMVRAGAIPRELALSPPSVQICAAEYRKEKAPAPADDPSIIFYDVDITLDESGKAQVNSRGAVGCEPMP